MGLIITVVLSQALLTNPTVVLVYLGDAVTVELEVAIGLISGDASQGEIINLATSGAMQMAVRGGIDIEVLRLLVYRQGGQHAALGEFVDGIIDGRTRHTGIGLTDFGINHLGCGMHMVLHQILHYCQARFCHADAGCSEHSLIRPAYVGCDRRVHCVGYNLVCQFV